MHAVESEMLCSNLLPSKVPYFNAPIYLENKTQIGKIDEILGPINEVYFTVKMNEGMVAGSFKKDDKIYIAADKLLPIERFLPKPKAPAGAKGTHGPHSGPGVAVADSSCFSYLSRVLFSVASSYQLRVSCFPHRPLASSSAHN